jgi:hypothetical protein
MLCSRLSRGSYVQATELSRLRLRRRPDNRLHRRKLQVQFSPLVVAFTNYFGCGNGVAAWNATRRSASEYVAADCQNINSPAELHDELCCCTRDGRSGPSDQS